MSSQSDILALRDRGFSNSAIGRAVGRDSSLISQIARGIKPGSNLTPALNSLVRGDVKPGEVRAPLPVASRTTKSGEAARVRRGGKTELPGGNVLIETVEGRSNLLRELRKAAKERRGVSFTVTLRTLTNYKDDGETLKGEGVSVYGKGGYDARKFLDEVEAAGGGKEGLDSVLLDAILNRPNVEDAAGVQDVTMQTFSRR